MSYDLSNAEMRGDLPPDVVREGVNFPWAVSERAVNAIKDYDVRADDVWIATYPKAGTHWAAEIVQFVLADGKEENIDRSKQPAPMEFDYAQPVSLGAKDPDKIPEDWRIPRYERSKTFPSPRVLITHLPEHMLPKQIYEGKGKVIVVLRNPKDLVVSYWHFLAPHKLNPKHEQWDTFFDLFCTEEIHYGSWFTHTLALWKKRRYDKNFLFLKYEKMKKDTRGVVVQIADFLGRPLSDEAIQRVVNKTTVGSMKQRFNTADDKSGERKIGAPSIIRKGVVGDWKAQFTVAQNDVFVKLYREKMEGSDLQLDFEMSRYFSTATTSTS